MHLSSGAIRICVLASSHGIMLRGKSIDCCPITAIGVYQRTENTHIKELCAENLDDESILRPQQTAGAINHTFTDCSLVEHWKLDSTEWAWMLA